MMRPSPPRLFGIVARDSPVVAVLRRGPSDWWQVGEWRTAEGVFNPGAWLKGALYPQKCDLSPNGRWLAYSALKESVEWAAGSIYEAISRLPWLTALAAWEAGTTYTRGIHFSDDRGVSELGEPDVGSAGPCLAKYGLEVTRPVQFAVERRRGWVETVYTPPRETGGIFDEARSVSMEKNQPGTADGPRLVVEGSFAGFRSSPDYHDPPAYSLQWADRTVPLGDVQWADWDGNGGLLIATNQGELQTRTVIGTHTNPTWTHDLSLLKPDPHPAPGWASEW